MAIGRPRIRWDKILADLPGRGHRGKLETAYKDRTVIDLATLLGTNAASLAAYMRSVGIQVVRKVRQDDQALTSDERVNDVLAEYPGNGVLEKFEWAWAEANGNYPRLMALGLKEMDIRSLRTRVKLAGHFNYRAWLDEKLKGLDRDWLKTPAGQRHLISKAKSGELSSPTREEARVLARKNKHWQQESTRRQGGCESLLSRLSSGDVDGTSDPS